MVVGQLFYDIPFSVMRNESQTAAAERPSSSSRSTGFSSLLTGNVEEKKKKDARGRAGR